MIELNDVPNEVAYLRRVLKRDIKHLEEWISNPGHLRAEGVERFKEDLAAATSILGKLT